MNDNTNNANTATDTNVATTNSKKAKLRKYGIYALKGIAAGAVIGAVVYGAKTFFGTAGEVVVDAATGVAEAAGDAVSAVA